MSSLTKPLASVRKDEYFLDSVTGDIYGVWHDPDSRELTWHPVANAGIHYRRAAEEFNSIGKYVIKAPVYRPNGIKQVACKKLVFLQPKLSTLCLHELRRNLLT
jgi:hypothetical protein